MKKRGSRGFARYLVAICVGVGASLAWQIYGEVPKQIIATRGPEFGSSLGWTKPRADPESTAVQPSVPETQVATVGQTVPVPKALATPSIDPEQVHQIALDLGALRQTVDQLAASQDQMVHQIETLQTSNQEILTSNQAILEKIPAPPPVVAPTHKPATGR